ncbi:hypothetical protein [Cohnella sp. GCM10012308]|uniref:hypothetical protein n=1 Tax=Cohnella sp. GCM10012308 TaxID=3317329 RepID=UPI00361537EF
MREAAFLRAATRACGLPGEFPVLDGSKTCQYTCIFSRPALFDEIPANAQVISSHKPAAMMKEENTCTFASFLLKWGGIGE